MKSIRERIQFAHEGGLVTRFHTRMGIIRNTDAQHSHGVAMMCYFLTDTKGAHKVSAYLLMAALTHDLAEQVTGDVPAPTKWVFGANKLDALEAQSLKEYDLSFELTSWEKRTLKLADALDGILYCTDELYMGNRKVINSAERWISYITEQFGDASTLEREVIEAVFTIWKDCKNGEEDCPRFDLNKRS